jgi:hypothetical protein
MARRISWTWFPNATSCVIVVLMVATYVAPFGDLDFGILIRLGELIVRSGDLRPPESFSYTIASQDVPDHEWLFEIALYGVWTVFGYGGLKLCKVLLVGSTLVMLGLRLRSEGIRWHGVALSVGLAVVVCADSWNLRPLYFTTLGLLLTSWWLGDHCRGKRPLTWWLVPVMWLWANVHPGVIIGQLLLLGAIVWEGVNWWIRFNPPLPFLAWRRLALIGGLSIVVTFVAPDPIGRTTAPFRAELRHPIQRIYREMAPLYEQAISWPYTAALTYVIAVLVLVTIVFRFRLYRLWEIALLAGLGLLANLASRSLQDWVLIMLSLAVPQMVRLLRQLSIENRRRPWVAALLRLDRSCKSLFQSALFRFQWRWPVLALCLLAVLSLTPPIGRAMPRQARDRDPVAAVDWIDEHRLPSEPPWKVFAPPDYGAYLVWRLGENVRDYVDTRGFCFPPELMQDGHQLPRLDHGWKARLQRVLTAGTQYFFLETTGDRGKLWEWLRQHGARYLYLDEQAVLLSAEEVQRVFAESQKTDAS